MGGAKQPIRVTLKSGEHFPLAGLLGIGDPEGEIVPIEPNEPMRPIHDRMLTIHPAGQESPWLDDEVWDPGEPAAPYPAELMDAYTVSTLVNRQSSDGPEVAASVGRGLL